jgi:LysR family glycine cleavage system transcriptional activator
MNLDLPPLTWLRAFEASARTLSFTHAASELHITQAAVSKHVKSLESHLRQPLFLRRPRGLELTKSGAAYLPKVQDAMARLAIGTREVFGQRHTSALTLRCAVSFAVNWLAPRLPDFLDRHPGKSIRLLSSVWNDAFDTEDFDLDIQYGTGHWPGFNSYRLTWETITPLCAPSLSLKSPDDLQHHRLLHVLGYHEG